MVSTIVTRMIHPRGRSANARRPWSNQTAFFPVCSDASGGGEGQHLPEHEAAHSQLREAARGSGYNRPPYLSFTSLCSWHIHNANSFRELTCGENLYREQQPQTERSRIASSRRTASLKSPMVRGVQYVGRISHHFLPRGVSAVAARVHGGEFVHKVKHKLLVLGRWVLCKRAVRINIARCVGGGVG